MRILRTWGEQFEANPPSQANIQYYMNIAIKLAPTEKGALDESIVGGARVSRQCHRRRKR